MNKFLLTAVAVVAVAFTVNADAQAFTHRTSGRTTTIRCRPSVARHTHYTRWHYHTACHWRYTNRFCHYRTFHRPTCFRTAIYRPSFCCRTVTCRRPVVHQLPVTCYRPVTVFRPVTCYRPVVHRPTTRVTTTCHTTTCRTTLVRR